MDDGGAGLIPQFLIIIVLTLINAFFASAELAIVSCNKTKIQTLAEEGNEKAKKLLNITKDQTRFLRDFSHQQVQRQQFLVLSDKDF